ncbi:MAG: hypothetical protein U0183_22740 [Polyangiaceae bacterium]
MDPRHFFPVVAVTAAASLYFIQCTAGVGDDVDQGELGVRTGAGAPCSASGDTSCSPVTPPPPPPCNPSTDRSCSPVTPPPPPPCNPSTDRSCSPPPPPPPPCDPSTDQSCSPPPPPPVLDAGLPPPPPPVLDAGLPPPPPVPCNPSTDTTCVAAQYASELGTIPNGRVECFSSPTADPARVELRCTFYFASLGANATYVAIGERSGVKMVPTSASYLECPPGPSPVVCPPKVVLRSMLESSTPSALWGGISTTLTDGTVIGNGINSLARIRPNVR